MALDGCNGSLLRRVKLLGPKVTKAVAAPTVGATISPRDNQLIEFISDPPKHHPSGIDQSTPVHQKKCRSSTALVYLLGMRAAQVVEQSGELFLLPFPCCFSHTVSPWDTRFPLCVGCMCDGTMFFFVCAFPPQPPPKIALPCSAASQVLRHSPSSPARACLPFGSWPSRTGLGRSTKACWRSPGSRACCFLGEALRREPIGMTTAQRGSG
jgi:hypothetical protein